MIISIDKTRKICAFKQSCLLELGRVNRRIYVNRVRRRNEFKSSSAIFQKMLGQ